jgi:hypothetical protein
MSFRIGTKPKPIVRKKEPSKIDETEKLKNSAIEESIYNFLKSKSFRHFKKSNKILYNFYAKKIIFNYDTIISNIDLLIKHNNEFESFSKNLYDFLHNYIYQVIPYIKNKKIIEDQFNPVIPIEDQSIETKDDIVIEDQFNPVIPIENHSIETKDDIFIEEKLHTEITILVDNQFTQTIIDTVDKVVQTEKQFEYIFIHSQRSFTKYFSLENYGSGLYNIQINFSTFEFQNGFVILKIEYLNEIILYEYLHSSMIKHFICDKITINNNFLIISLTPIGTCLKLDNDFNILLN